MVLAAPVVVVLVVMVGAEVGAAVVSFVVWFAVVGVVGTKTLVASEGAADEFTEHCETSSITVQLFETSVLFTQLLLFASSEHVRHVQFRLVTLRQSSQELKSPQSAAVARPNKQRRTRLRRATTAPRLPDILAQRPPLVSRVCSTSHSQVPNSLFQPN